MIIPFDCICSSNARPSSSRYVESRLEERRLKVELLNYIFAGRKSWSNKYYPSANTHLVRLGGAGACLPLLLVVLRICTLLVVGVVTPTLDAPGTPLFATNVLNCFEDEDTVPVSDNGVTTCSDEACDCEWCFLPICGVNVYGGCPPWESLSWRSTASVIDDSCKCGRVI